MVLCPKYFSSRNEVNKTLDEHGNYFFVYFQTCLRHPDSKLAVGNRNGVFHSMRNAMKILRAIVQENEYPDPNISRAICLDMKDLQVSFCGKLL